MMEPLVKAFQELVVSLGPAGAVGVLTSGVVLWFYRRDFIRERRNHTEAREIAARREDRALTLAERNATVMESLAQEIRHLTEWLQKNGQR